MSKLYDAYLTNKDAESSGVWVDEADASFKVARMGGANLRYQKALTAAMKPHMREAQLGMLEESVAEPIMRKVFIDTVLLDWKNVSGFDDLPMEFTKDNAEKLFADLPDLYAHLREQAGSYANYRAAVLEATSKNS